MKKSEVYQSNFFGGGTAPKYETLLALQKSIIRSMEEYMAFDIPEASSNGLIN